VRLHCSYLIGSTDSIAYFADFNGVKGMKCLRGQGSVEDAGGPLEIEGHGTVEVTTK
jgi:hypothetical protein